MSRSAGATSLTTRAPIEIVARRSRPRARRPSAARSTCPEPDGPDEDRELAVGDLQVEPVDGAASRRGRPSRRPRTRSMPSAPPPEPPRCGRGTRARCASGSAPASRSRRARSRSACRSRAPTRSCRAATTRGSGARRRRRRPRGRSAARWSRQVRDPRRVLDDAVDERLVVERGAVLGDPDLAGRRSRPAAAAAGRAARSASTGQPIAVVCPRGVTVSRLQRRVRRLAHVRRVVVVDAEEVDRPRDHVQVLGVERRQRPEDALVVLEQLAPGRSRAAPGRGTSGSGGRPSAPRRPRRRPPAASG